jgi:diguanylate cyclase (GGDEF)-like protein
LLGLGATGRRHGSATRILLAALALWTVVDLLWAFGVLNHDAMLPERWQTGIRMIGYLCLAVGATVTGPSWSDVSPQHELGGDRRLLLPTAIGLILPGLTLLIDGLDGSVSWLQLGIVALIVSVLTVLRFDGLLAHVRHQARAFDRLARLDPLTGIANRRQWDEALAGLCAHADAVHQRLASDGDADLEAGTQSQTRLCLAVLDLDHFKEFNDAHGHAEGDRLLCETVQAWTGLLADTDLLARVGGEEFAVLMPGRDLVDAHLLTEVLLEATPRGRSCSAGLTERPPGTDPAAAMIRADRALYEAKANGRAQVRVAADPNTPDGLAALPTIVYQPIVTAAQPLRRPPSSRHGVPGRARQRLRRPAGSPGSAGRPRRTGAPTRGGAVCQRLGGGVELGALSRRATPTTGRGGDRADRRRPCPRLGEAPSGDRHAAGPWSPDRGRRLGLGCR